MKYLSISPIRLIQGSALLVALTATTHLSMADPTTHVTSITPAKPTPPLLYTPVTAGSVTIAGTGTITTDQYDYTVQTSYLIQKWIPGATPTSPLVLDVPDPHYWPDEEVLANTTTPYSMPRTMNVMITTTGKYHGSFVFLPLRDTHDGFTKPYPDGDSTDFDVELALDGPGGDIPGGGLPHGG